jgi:hypothetical protein
MNSTDGVGRFPLPERYIDNTVEAGSAGDH